MITWREPSYPGDRHLALCGEISVGAVFPPIGGKYWRWRCWIGTTTNPSESYEKTEAVAKAAVAMRFQAFLDKAGLEPRMKASAA